MLLIRLCIVVIVSTSIKVLANVEAEPKPCPVSQPCSCDTNNILCNNVNLTEVPFVSKVNISYTYGWKVDLSYNNITHIPPKAFINIKVWSVQISHNKISKIADDAFHGSEDNIGAFFMQFNNFTDLPSVLGRLKNMNMLSIHDNPIKVLPVEILRNMSTNVQFFDVGSPEMTVWPSAISHMKAMYSLTLYRLPMMDLPVNAFHGLESSPLILDFQSTKFTRIPGALRVLKNMTNLSFTANIVLNSSSFDKDSFKGMNSLTSLYINNSSITRVPDISELPNLTELTLTNCPLSQWDENTLPENPRLALLGFDDTEFQRIPAVISILKNISRISLFNSKVNEITNTDLSGLVNLQALTLSHSPVTFISEYAFRDNKNLLYMMLDNMKIRGFPKAIESITAAKVIDLSNNDLTCTCKTMGWMIQWAGLGHTFIDGTCQNLNNTEVQSFVDHSLPNC